MILQRRFHPFRPKTVLIPVQYDLAKILYPIEAMVKDACDQFCEVMTQGILGALDPKFCFLDKGSGLYMVRMTQKVEH